MHDAGVHRADSLLGPTESGRRRPGPAWPGLVIRLTVDRKSHLAESKLRLRRRRRLRGSDGRRSIVASYDQLIMTTAQRPVSREKMADIFASDFG